MPHRFSSDKCFIISPIGDLKSASDQMRSHVEWVRTDIIDAALALANLELSTKLHSVRADMNASTGDILNEVLQAILSDKLLFVVLTGDVRPNVYYELGIAHSAARPVIILQEEGLRRQFDFYHYKTIEYSFDSKGVANPPIEAVKKAIIETYRTAEPEVAFRNPLYDPLNKQNANITLFPRFNDIPYADWSRMLNRATSTIDFVGTTLLDLTKVDNDGFLLTDDDRSSNRSLVDFIAAKILFGGIDVTVSLIHEDNPSLEAMLKASSGGVDPRFVEQVRQEIDWSTRRWTDFARAIGDYDAATLKEFNVKNLSSDTLLPPEKRGSFALFKIIRGQIKFRMSLTDAEILVTPILYRHGRNGSGPAFKIRSRESLYNSLKTELDYLKDTNADQTVIVVGDRARRRA